MTTDDDLSLDPLALAIEEQFLREWQAGKRPRLSVYAARYPAYANALAELVASLPADAADATDHDAQPEALLESFPERHSMDEGVNRALMSIFGEVQLRRSVSQRGRVAEERQTYDAGQPDDANTLTEGRKPEDQ